jgi:dienelactone hydrolase
MRGALICSMLAVVSTASIATSAHAQFVQQHIIAFESSTPTSMKDFLQGNKGSAITLAGELNLAKPPGQKQPAVVLMPGAGGIGAPRHTSGEWARVLNEAGIAAFIVDSFTARKLYVIGEHATLPPLYRVLDAFAALKVLSEHPFIDAGKISVMGFSHGSMAAMYTNIVRFQKMYGGDKKFAAHVSIYGLCGTKFRGDEEMTSPMLIQHGAADDWVPAAPCIDYAERLAKAGKDVRIITYPDAYHAFDSVSIGAMKKLDFTTSAGCRQEETETGDVVSVDTHKPLDLKGKSEACWKKGVQFGSNEAATKKAHEDAIAFLKEKVLK